MNKSIQILLSIFIFSSLLFAQYTTVWEKSQAQANFPTFMSTGNLDRGFGYGVVDGKEQVYLVSRLGAPNVLILDAATGDSLGKLSTTGVSGGTFTLNDADVSADGKIFACNLTINTITSAFKVYRWDYDTTSAPINVISFTTPASYRLGDVFTVVGSTADNSITIYAHASGQDTVFKFTTTDNGNSFTASAITLSNGASGSVANVAPTGTGDVEFYTKSAGRTVARFTSSGTLIDTLSSGIVSSAATKLTYWEDGSRKFIAVYNYGVDNENLRVVDVTNGLTDAKLIFVTNSLGTLANLNGSGDVAAAAIGKNNYKLFALATNNGIACYITNFLTIAQAIEDLDNDYVPDRVGDTVTVEGVVFSPNYQTTNNSFYIYDGTAGTDIFMYGPPVLTMAMGDMVQATGVVTHYNGMTEIVVADTNGWVFKSAGNPTPAPIVITLGQYKSNPELYEGSLVGFVSLTKVSGTWPASGSANLSFSDGVDTVVFRIDSDTDIDGNPEPTWPRDVIGIGSQFDNSAPYDGGYQIFPRYFANDFLPPGTIPVELVSFSANVVDGSVVLNWKTATEKNNLGYAVQRSLDGQSFVDIGFVTGSGTTTEAKSYSFIDSDLGTAQKLYYRLRQIDYNGTAVYTSIINVDLTRPLSFNLSQNYPNPFNPSTIINFSIPVDAKVKVRIYDILGKEVFQVVNDNLKAGNHLYPVSFENVSSGVYIYSIEATGVDGKTFKSSKKMTLMK